MEIDSFELSLGNCCQDGKLVEGPGVPGVDVAGLLVVLTSGAVVGRIL